MTHLTLVKKSDNWKLKLLMLFRQVKLDVRTHLKILKFYISLVLFSSSSLGFSVKLVFVVPNNLTRVSEVVSLSV